jgi:hypothetical protein
MANTLGFRYCTKCHLLHYAPTPEAGGCTTAADDTSECPGGKGPWGKHDDAPGEYAMRLAPGGAGAESGWDVCSRCKCMVNAIYKQKRCIGGKDHDIQGVLRYVVRRGDASPGMEAGWKCCRKCQALFWTRSSASAGPGSCYLGTGDHDGAGSPPYALRFLPASAPDHFTLRWPNLVCHEDKDVTGTLSLGFHKTGTVTVQYDIQTKAIFVDANVKLAYQIITHWGEKDVQVLGGIGHLAARGPFSSGASEVAGAPSDYTNDFVADNWVDVSPSCEVMVVLTRSNDAATLLAAGFGIAGLALGVPGVVQMALKL